jgi:membrane-bound lytic murein transglycosylase D
MFRVVIFLTLWLTSLSASAANFPRPAALEPAVNFWVKVYTQISTEQGYIHDNENLAVIYETIAVPPTLGRDERDRQISAAQQRAKTALNSLGRGKRTGLSPAEAQVLAAWPAGTTSATFAQAAQRVRFQLGQSDRFLEGLARSGQWKAHIREVLIRHELPLELGVLPHVESSFNPSAYSKVAAAGMWQFMPATARQYMRVDAVMDERMDPFIATEGAARLLKTNYKITGTWPLALTSYNHGAGGMKRATQAMGTTDIDVIVQKYKGAAFGFASRNFYASFLAALQVDSDPGRYFRKVRLEVPTPYDVVIAQDYISASALAHSTGLGLDELRRYNPALLEPVWSGEKYIPRGYSLRVPKARLNEPLDKTVASLSSGGRFSHQKPDLMYQIAKGDSLSTIANRYGTSVSKLMALNGLRNYSIRAGTSLILPGNTKYDAMSASQIASAGARLTAGQPGGREYVIRSGDSLWSIARRFKVSTQQLVTWNALSATQYLQPGQKLKVASSG